MPVRVAVSRQAFMVKGNRRRLWSSQRLLLFVVSEVISVVGRLGATVSTDMSATPIKVSSYVVLAVTPLYSSNATYKLCLHIFLSIVLDLAVS